MKLCNTPEEVKEIIEKHDAVLIDIFSKGCDPCVELEERLRKVQEKHEKIEVIKIRKDEMRKNEKKWMVTLPFLKQAYELPGVPVLVFVKQGKIIDQHLDDAREGLGLYWGSAKYTTIINTLKQHAML